jgi:hypothetical protein
MRGLLFIGFMLSMSSSFAQQGSKLEDALVNQNWKKVFKLISKEINGTRTPTNQYNAVFDSLISHFKSYDCIVDAEWSKCGAKILIYPGQETIAIRFKTDNLETEKSFLINTAKYQTSIRVLGIGLRIPTIDRKELVVVLMRDSDQQSMIKVMRNTCLRVAEEAKRRVHNKKVFVQARILNGNQDGGFRPLNFNCQNNTVAIEFSASNQTDDSLKIYWPSSIPMSDPLFRISFRSYSSELSVQEDTSVYVKRYQVITLKPRETIKTIQFLAISGTEKRTSEPGLFHFYSQLQLDDFQRFSTEKGIARIGMIAVNNGLSGREDDIWKPAEALYIFNLSPYTITEICE